MSTQAKLNPKIKKRTKAVSNFSIRFNNWLESISCTGTSNPNVIDHNMTKSTMSKAGKTRPSSPSFLAPIKFSDSAPIKMTPDNSSGNGICAKDNNSGNSDTEKHESQRILSPVVPPIDCNNPADKPLKSILKKPSATRSSKFPSLPSSSTLSLSDPDSTAARSPSVSFYESPEMMRRSLVRANSCGNNTHKFNYLKTVHAQQPLRRIQSELTPKNQWTLAQQQQLYFMREKCLQQQYQQHLFQKFHSSNIFPVYNISPVAAADIMPAATNLQYFPFAQAQFLLPSVQLQL